jgi:hypothetical protein
MQSALAIKDRPKNAQIFWQQGIESLGRKSLCKFQSPCLAYEHAMLFLRLYLLSMLFVI